MDFDSLEEAEEEAALTSSFEGDGPAVTVRVCSALSAETLVQVDAALGTTIRSLKSLLEFRMRVPASELRLVSGTRRLYDHETLGDVICDGASGPLDIMLVRISPTLAKILDNVRGGRKSFARLDDEFRSDPDVVLAAIDADSSALKYATSVPRQDRTVVLRAVACNGAMLQYASEELRADPEIVKAAVRCHPESLRYAMPSLQADEDIVLMAVENNSDALKHAALALRDDPNYALKVVRCRGTALKHLASNLQSNKAIVLAAVQQSGTSLRFAAPFLRNDHEIVMEAIESSNGAALGSASESLRAERELVRRAIQLDGKSLKFAPLSLQKDKELVLQAVQRDGKALQYAAAQLRTDRTLATKAVRQDGKALEYVSAELRNDINLVRAALESCGMALEFASERLRADHQTVLNAVKTDSDSLRFASQKLTADANFREEAAALGVDFRDEMFQQVLLVGTESAKKLFDAGATIFVDVRAQHEFEKSHIPGAHPMSFVADSGVFKIMKESARHTVIVYGDMGLDISRCVSVARALRMNTEIDAHRVLRLMDGLNNWKKLGFPVHGDTRPMMMGSIMHDAYGDVQ